MTNKESSIKRSEKSLILLEEVEKKIISYQSHSIIDDIEERENCIL